MKLFDVKYVNDISASYAENGYVAVTGMFSTSEVQLIVQATDHAVSMGYLEYFYDLEPTGEKNQELVEAGQVFKELARHTLVVKLARSLLGQDVELQHAKMTLKPLNKAGLGQLEWHQDYPFFPHSNTDLLACSILLDDETADNSPLGFLPKSHLLGILDHYSGDEFAYRCTDLPSFSEDDVDYIDAPAGTVVFHHCLTLHKSSASQATGRHRRHLVYQYRAKDALQLAGVIRASNGMPVDQSEASRKVRFNIGETLKMIGVRRKLFDPHGRLGK